MHRLLNESKSLVVHRFISHGAIIRISASLLAVNYTTNYGASVQVLLLLMITLAIDSSSSIHTCITYCVELNCPCFYFYTR